MDNADSPILITIEKSTVDHIIEMDSAPEKALETLFELEIPRTHYVAKLAEYMERNGSQGLRIGYEKRSQGGKFKREVTGVAVQVENEDSIPGAESIAYFFVHLSSKEAVIKWREANKRLAGKSVSDFYTQKSDTLKRAEVSSSVPILHASVAYFNKPEVHPKREHFANRGFTGNSRIKV